MALWQLPPRCLRSWFPSPVPHLSWHSQSELHRARIAPERYSVWSHFLRHRLNIPSGLRNDPITTTPFFTVPRRPCRNYRRQAERATLARLMGLVVGLPYHSQSLLARSLLLHELGTNLAAEVSHPACGIFLCRCRRAPRPPLPQQASTGRRDRAIDCLNDYTAPAAY